MDTTQSSFSLVNDIPWMTILKIISVAINLFVLFKWIVGKIVLNRFLVGRWEGNILNDQTKARLNCILIVTECAGRDNKAFFYYEHRNNEGVTVRGGDELDDYDSDTMFIFHQSWNPTFFRQFHMGYNDKVEREEIDFNETVKYQWTCKIQNIWSKPKLKVSIEGNNVTLKGKLHKS